MDELTQIVTEDEPEEITDDSSLRNSTIAYHAVILVLDAMSGVLVGMMTLWAYGIIWFLAGAIAFFLHHKNWETASNNDKQTKNAEVGMMVSVGAVVLMALASGSIYLLTENKLLAVEGGYIGMVVELATVSLFCWHGLQFALYRFADDSFVTNRQIAKAKGIANKKIQFAKAAGSVVQANQRFIDERNAQRAKHGEQAVDGALAKISGVPMLAKAATVDGVQMENPTTPPTQKV